MSRPWMPFYPADYLGDTGHLTTLQHGAYVLLILHYWQRSGLPDDDAQLASIAKMTAGDWKRARPILHGLFQHPGWRHKRIDEELAEAEAKYNKRANAGQKGGKAKAMSQHCSSNATAGLYQPQSHSPNGESERETRGREAWVSGGSVLSQDAWEIAEGLMAASGKDKDDPGSMGLVYAAQTWLNEQIPKAFILERAMPVARKHVNYIAKTVRSAWAENRAPPGTPPAINGKSGDQYGKPSSASAAARRLRETGTIFGPKPGSGLRLAAGGTDVRLLPQGRGDES